MTLNLTNLEFTCQGVGQTGCSFGIGFESVVPFSFTATMGDSYVDGTSGSSNPGRISIVSSVEAFDAAGYTVAMSYDVVAGSAAFDSSQEMAFGSDPLRQGPVTRFKGGLMVSGLQEGDTIRFPGSVGVAFAAPPASVPDPGSTLLLLGMGLAGLTAVRRRRG